VEARNPKRSGALRHTLIMVLCCLIPLAVLAIMWAAGVSKNYLILGVALLCPVVHLVMMGGMNRGRGSGGGHIHSL